MTTITLKGFRGNFDGQGDLISASEADFVLTYADTTTGFFWQPDTQFDPGIVSANILTDGTYPIYGATFGGVDLLARDDQGFLETVVLQVTWSAGISFILDFYDEGLDTDFFVYLGGSAQITNAAVAEQVVTTAGTAVNPAAGTGFGPNELIPFNLLPNVMGITENDTINGTDGADTIDSGIGNDLVASGNGADLVYLGLGNDQFVDTPEAGPEGNDTIYGGAGNDTIQGGNGDDQFFGNQNNDLIFGRLGNDRIYGGIGYDTIDAGDGSDSVWGEDGRDLVQLGNGFDLFTDNGQGGENGRDTVYGWTGNDTIQGGNGDDEFHGNQDNDLIFGRLGNDLIFGGIGFDTIDAGDGNDSVYGGDGRDRVILGNGADIFFDTAQGGLNGRDTVFGGAGNDTIQGGNGDDEFYGNQDNDLIFARLGNDTLFGGVGDDTLSGGDDADTFVFFAGDGADTIADFTVGEDVLRLSSSLWAGSLTADQVVADFADTTSGTVVFTFAGGSSITLQGLAVTDGLDAAIQIF